MKRVCVIGNLNIDLVLFPLEKLPEWRKEQVAQNMQVRSAGAAGNTAFALTKLGIPVSVIGSVGNDSYGQKILKELERFSVNTRGIKVSKSLRTGLGISLVKKGGERAFVTYLGTLGTFTKKDVMRHTDLMEKADYILLCGYFVLPRLGFRETLYILKWLNKREKTVLFDTGWVINSWKKRVKEIQELLEHVDIFLPNLDEATGLTEDASSPLAIARELLGYGCGMVIIKLGEEGSLAINTEGVFKEKSFATKTLDTTGAGDAFNAAILYGLIQEWDVDTTLRFANAEASITINRTENRYPTIKEVKELLTNRDL